MSNDASAAAAGPAPAPESASPPLPRVIRDLLGWNALAMLAVGRKTGMLDAIIAAPATADELRARAGVDARNAAAWLAAMTAHDYLTCEDGRFTFREDEAEAFRSFPFDLNYVIDYTDRIAGAMPAVIAAVRSGKGVAPAVYHEHLGDIVARIPARLYEMALVAWLDQLGVGDRLRAGGTLLELGCGAGGALLHLAQAMPDARFIGIDLDERALAAARAEAARRGLRNLRFEVRNVEEASADAVDVALILDALHHFAHPVVVLQRVIHSLKPGGKIVFAESTATGDVVTDAASPFARIHMSSSVLYCMQEGLHDGGVGLGTTYGTTGYRRLLEEAGYADIVDVDTDAGYTLFMGGRP